MSTTNRWNIRRQGDSIFICNGEHDKNEACQEVEYVIKPTMIPIQVEKQLHSGMADAFLRWKLPQSVRADLCATQYGPGRLGTNLLSYSEAYTMLAEIVMPVFRRELVARTETICAPLPEPLSVEAERKLNKMAEVLETTVNTRDELAKRVTELEQEVDQLMNSIKAERLSYFDMRGQRDKALVDVTHNAARAVEHEKAKLLLRDALAEIKTTAHCAAMVGLSKEDSYSKFLELDAKASKALYDTRSNPLSPLAPKPPTSTKSCT